MNIKDLYLQSYIGGGSGLAKKEALQIPKAFNAKNRARIRQLLGLTSKNKYFNELKSLVNNTNSGHIPFDRLEQDYVLRRNLNQNLDWFSIPRIGIVSNYHLQQSPELSKQLLNNLKDNLKVFHDMKLPLMPPDGRIKLNSPLHNLAIRLARKRSIQKGGLHTLPDTSPEEFSELYKGYYGAFPFKTAIPAHRAPTTGGYAENGALWFAPSRRTAERYGENLAIFKTTPEIKVFAERTATPHLGSSVSWEDRISGKARRDAQTIYKGKGGKHYQEDPNDVNYETVLPYQHWGYYLQHPELVTLYDKSTKMGYTPLYRKLLI